MTSIILAAILLLLFLGLALAGVLYEIKKGKLDLPTKKFIQGQWHKAEALSKNDLRAAIFEADKILAFTLTKTGATENITKKIKQFESRFKDPELVYQAHRLRNLLAHQVDFHPSNQELQQKFNYFRGALTDLGVFKY